MKEDNDNKVFTGPEVLNDNQNTNTKTKEELLKEKLEELRKRDPYIYR